MIPARIVAIGASSVHGRVDAEGGGFVGRLRRWHEAQARVNAVFNLGIGGQTSAQILARLERETKLRNPDLLLIQLGLNDTRREGSPSAERLIAAEETYANMEETLRRAKQIADCLVVSVHPIDESKTSPLMATDTLHSKLYFRMDDCGAHHKEVMELCRQAQLPVTDIFSAWEACDYSKWLSDDGLHANSEGHQQIFEMIRDTLISLYGDR